MKLIKCLTVAVVVLSLIIAYAMILPQYFPYEFLIKTYYLF